MSKGRVKVVRDVSMKMPRKVRDVGNAFARALALHQSGLIADAQILYEGILRRDPHHFDSLHNLGVSNQQTGHFDEAERLIRRALAVAPRSAVAHSNLGLLLAQSKRFEDALASFEKAVALGADDPEAFFNKGHVLGELKRFEEALACYDWAIALKPDFGDAWNNRGVALRALHRLDEAVASYDRAIALKPRHAEVFNNRATALFGLRRYDEAVASYDAALSVKSDYADAWTNRGEALFALGRLDEALESHDKALAINPNLAAAWRGRANVLRTGRVGEAIAACHRALAIEPNSARALTLLGQCHASQGNTVQAVACYDRALALEPDGESTISSRIFALDFAADAGFAAHQAARAYWWEQIGAKIAARSPRHHDNGRDPTRRIVLGYVSSDFRKHSAAFGFSPVLRNHDRSQFEVICYSCSPVDDPVTQYFQRIADRWRSASQWSDDRLADEIRADKVDILIDLSGHTAGHRLRTFASKPAPIQVTAWGHSTGTGLPTIDYLFSDPVAIPAAVRHLFAERIYDLPCLVIIDPPLSAPPTSQPPVLSNGHITYGVFNRIDKISEHAVRVWARILQRDGSARLLIKDNAVDDPSIRSLLRERFAGHGVAADRIDLLGYTSRKEHISAFRQVDVCLDPFPQNGGVSTWEALHVGVPVVAKLGDGIPSRLSGAILSSIGMTDWVAADDDEYAEIALKLASMPDRLRTLRQELPTRIATSSECNPQAYTRAVEDAYRAMWKDYCGRHLAQSADSAFARAVALHQNGLLADAQVLYEGILRSDSNHFGSLHLLGVSKQQTGHLDAAERLIRRALAIDPRAAAAHSNLGLLLAQSKRFEEALACFDTAIALKADYAEAFFNKGHALGELKRFEEALACYDRAIALKPDFGDAWNNRGIALRALQRLDEAVASYDRAILLKPSYVEAFNNRGTVLSGLRRYDDAVASYDAALSIEPACGDAWTNRGEVLFALGRFDEALASHDKALAINPNMAAGWLGRADILRIKRVGEAIAACHRALAIEPNSARALTLLGQCHAMQGNTDQAIACYDRALAIEPDGEYTISSRIFALDFAADAGFAEHQAARAYWWEQIGAKIAARSRRHHDNDRDPTRRIVLGYVSSDFRKHSAAFGFSPVLKNHDRSRFEVICYSCSAIEDPVTEYFQQIADRWRSASQWSDDRLADEVRADKVDILIDLSGHTAGHRLRTFASNPAPIQVTAWGHSTGTGLPTIDYLFSDPVAIPAAVRHLFAERIYDLPCLVIIDPPLSAPPTSQPPVLSNGHITYGVFNRIDKISEHAVEVWARILQRDATARLLIKHQAVDDPAIRLALREKFLRYGVVTDRIDLLGSTSRSEHIAAYEQVDVCLDPFPQNGGISTWEALHVGVPVVAKLGDSLPSRLSGAILSSIGMTDWVAADDDEYAEIALKSAATPDRLRMLRQGLPTRIAMSSRCSPEGYARAVEQAYRAMWKAYCERPG